MSGAEILRRTAGGQELLTEGPDGFVCSEGDCIVIVSRTAALPELRLRGGRLAPESLVQVDGHFEARYVHRIDSWAGRTLLALYDGSLRHELKLDVGPHQLKLEPGGWDELIRELTDISPALPWGVSPGGGAGRMIDDALAAVHPAIIEHQLPLLQKLLTRLLADPPTLSRRIRTVQPLSLSRGADLRTVRWLARRPLELAGLRGEAPPNSAPDPRAMADQPEILTSFDHPVTRYIVYLLRRIQARLAATVDRLASARQPGVPDPAVKSYALDLATSVEAAKVKIGITLKAPLFRNVSAEPLSDAVLQSLPDHPLFLALHRCGRRLLSPGLAYAPGQDVFSALKHSYDLFEILVLYRLAAQIGDALPEGWTAGKVGAIEAYDLEDRPEHRTRWTWREPDGRWLELTYQASFKAAGAGGGKNILSSLSARGVPDYVLAMWDGDNLVSWIILDAKYRSGQQSIHDALADIHRYRDSLRMVGRPAAGAYIIVPHLQEGATLYSEATYLEAYSFGALALYSGEWAQPVLAWLSNAAA